MHVLITDSGVGGLSVCAYAERHIRIAGCPDQPLRLTYANAAPENDYGYNSMSTREQKLETFDRFLRNVTSLCDPDMIYVACNTLSVLLHDVPYVKNTVIPVRGIVETAIDQLLARYRHDSDRAIVVFGTPTTIEAGTYRRLLIEHGVEPSRIVSQACPGLADIISEDRRGDATAEAITSWVRTAAEKMPGDAPSALVCLACTHYGYRKDLFARAFEALDIDVEVVNPNEDAVADLSLPEPNPANAGCDVPIEFITRYRIPPTTLETLSWFLESISPATVRALHEFRHIPDLF